MRIANPEILWRSEELTMANEGCLSLPEHYADVERPAEIRLRYLDHENEVREIEAKGLLATCLQHEIDHLDGRLFVDHISTLKRGIILRKLTKASAAARSRRRSKHCAGKPPPQPSPACGREPGERGATTLPCSRGREGPAP